MRKKTKQYRSTSAKGKYREEKSGSENPISTTVPTIAEHWAKKILIALEIIDNFRKREFKSKRDQLVDRIPRLESFKESVFDYRKRFNIDPRIVINEFQKLKAFDSDKTRFVEKIKNRIDPGVIKDITFGKNFQIKKCIKKTLVKIISKIDFPSNWNYAMCLYIFTDHFFPPLPFKVRLGRDSIKIEIFGNTNLSDMGDLWSLYQIDKHQNKYMRGHWLKKIKTKKFLNRAIMVSEGRFEDVKGVYEDFKDYEDFIQDPSRRCKDISRLNKPYSK